MAATTSAMSKPTMRVRGEPSYSSRKDQVLCSVDAVNLEIGQEEAQSVIDSITASYAAEGQPMPNPAMLPPGAFPPPFGLPGTMLPSNPKRIGQVD